MTTGQAFYAKQGTTYVIKLVGEIRYTMGCSLDDFLNRLFAKGDYTDILVDLTEAISVDSTSLGLLAKIANFMRMRYDRKVTLISTNADINQMLDNVGFYQVFNICDDRAACVEATQQLPLEEISKPQLTRTVYEAHALLSELNERNRDSFKGVVEALRTKLASTP